MKKFCMPSDFKHETIEAYTSLNDAHEGSKVVETYGQLAPDTLFGSCRISRQLPPVDRNRLEKYVDFGRDKGIEFNYVVNATCMSNDDLTPEGFNKLKAFFRMLQDIGVSSITAALPTIMEIAAYTAPSLNIKASTVCQINSPLKAEWYSKMGVKRLVLDEDIYRRFDLLKNIRKVYDGSLEIIVNSFCTLDCPNKMFDYNMFSHSHEAREIYRYYASRCRRRHTGAENYMKLNWIRPEDIHHYSDIGIEYFKVQGRTNVFSGDPARAAAYYMDESYDGDLVALLELFSPKRPLTIGGCYIDNKKLDGFWERFVNHPEACTKVCGSCGWCRSFAEASISSGDRAFLEILYEADKLVPDEFPGCLEV